MHIYPPDYTAPPPHDYTLNHYPGAPAKRYPNMNENADMNMNMFQYDIPYSKNGATKYGDSENKIKDDRKEHYYKQMPGQPQQQFENETEKFDYYSQTSQGGLGSYEPEDEPEFFKFMGIFPTIPIFNLMKIMSMVILFIIVELNIFYNMNSDLFIGDYLASDIGILFGVGLIGVFLGFLYRYIKFEFARMNWNRVYQNKGDLKNYLTLIFLIILFIFIYIEVIIELLSSRGPLLIIDMLSIHCMTFGTYAIFSGKRYINIFTMVFLFIIMILGWDFHLDLPLVLLLGILTIMYLELSDGACKLQEYIIKYHEISDSGHFKQRSRDWLDQHLNAFSIQFIINLGVFLGLTLLISILLLSIFYIYPFITPPYMAENIELQSVYAILPIIAILALAFLIVYLYQSRASSTKKIINL
jgi:hypothetical protein